MRCSWATSVFTCTGLNRPTRIICAIPRASLRSVLLICCDADYWQLGRRQSIDQPLRQRAGLDPNPAEARAERGQNGDDIGRLGRDLLRQDHLAGIVDYAHRRFLHRHVKTNKIHHLIAPSPMIEVVPTSIQSQEGDAHSASKREPQPPRYTILTKPTAAAHAWRPELVFMPHCGRSLQSTATTAHAPEWTISVCRRRTVGLRLAVAPWSFMSASE